MSYITVQREIEDWDGKSFNLEERIMNIEDENGDNITTSNRIGSEKSEKE